MSKVKVLSHIYDYPEYYDIAIGRPIYCADFEAYRMVEMIDRHYDDIPHLHKKCDILEIASGPKSKYECAFKNYIEESSRITKFTYFKSDFVGKRSKDFISFDILDLESCKPNQVDILLAPYYTYRTLMDFKTKKNDYSVMVKAIKTSSKLLRSKGLLIANIGSDSDMQSFEREVLNLPKGFLQGCRIPYNSPLLTKRRTSADIRIKGKFDKLSQTVKQDITFKFNDGSKAKTENSFEYLTYRSNYFVVAAQDAGLKYLKGYSETYYDLSDEARDSVIEEKTPSDSQWLVFQKE